MICCFLIYASNASAEDCDKSVFRKLGQLKKSSNEIELSTAAQFALDSESGNLFLRSLQIDSSADLLEILKSDQPNVPEFRTQLLERLREVDANVARFRGLQVKTGAAESGKTPQSPLSANEQLLIELIASRSLVLKPEANALLKKQLKVSSPLFFEDVTDGNIQNEKDFFVGKQASAAEIKIYFDKKQNNLFSAMKECLANQTAADSAFSKQAVQAAISQIVTSDVITFTSAVAVTGIANLHVKDLSLSLFITAISNGLGTLFLNGGGSMLQRLGKAIVIYQLSNAANVGLYVFTPGPPDQASWEKYGAYFGAWMFAAPVLALPLNVFLNGLQCLNPQAKWFKLANIGSRTALAAGINISVFAGAETFLYKKDDK